jgi:hypothetical protein
LAKCSGITQAGTACKGIPIAGSQWCYVHHPDHAEERKRHGSRGGKRGGRGRPNGDTAELRGLLSELYTNVLDGAVAPNVAAVAAQIANARIRLLETERRLREQEELEARLTALEEFLEQRGGRRTWGT